jgi:hypothetical protein
LLRTLPFQVKVSVWACAAPLLVRLICAEAVVLKGTDWVVPVFPIEPGSAMLRLPPACSVPPPKVPVTPLMFDWPSQSERSLTRFMSPVS